jgi:hypothetical protein
LRVLQSVLEPDFDSVNLLSNWLKLNYAGW